MSKVKFLWCLLPVLLFSSYGCPIPMSLSSCQFLLHYLPKISFQILFWGGGGQNSETFIIQFSCHFSQFGTLFIFSISTQIFLVPTEGKNSKNLLVNVFAISGNLEHFSFFPFVANFFLDPHYAMRGGGLKSFIKMLSSFFAILGDSKYFSFFLFLWTATMEGGGGQKFQQMFHPIFSPIPAIWNTFYFSLSSQMFWTPTMERGVKNGGGVK